LKFDQRLANSGQAAFSFNLIGAPTVNSAVGLSRQLCHILSASDIGAT
jgi:hypothetical protein